MDKVTADQRLLYKFEEMSQTVTETVAALIAPTLENSSVYTYDVATPGLFYWTNDGGGTTGGISNRLNSDHTNSHSSNSSSISSNNSGSSHNMSMADFAAMPTIGGYNNNTQLLSDYNGSDNSYQQYCQMLDTNTNLTYWNVTCDNPLGYVTPLYGYCMPFLLVTTIISNSLIVLVLGRKHMATPTNFVLMVMAICDMLTVIFPAPGLWYMYTFGNHYKPLHPVSMCLLYMLFNEIMPAMCHTASIWLTLALAVQRYIYVCHAPMARTWCTMPRVKRCTLYIAIGAFLHQSTRIFDRTYYPLTIDWRGEPTEVCHVETSPWVHNYIGEDVYFTFYFLFRVLFVHLLPCILLVTLNILLFRAMQQAQERRKLLFRENRKKECKKLRESNCTTLMLIVVVTVFLIVEIPIAVLTAMHIVSSLIIEFLDYRAANVFVMFTNFFLVVSYPINFGIYCGMSRQFRETFKEIFLGHITTKKDNSSKYSIVNGPRTCTNTNETVL